MNIKTKIVFNLMKIIVAETFSKLRYLLLLFLLNNLIVQFTRLNRAFAVAQIRCVEVFNQFDQLSQQANQKTSYIKSGSVQPTKITAQELIDHTFRGMKLVPEFQFIRETAEKMGVRVWLFGGTASSFLHYVKWDLARSRGQMELQNDRFDYDYTNIFRSTQDLDIAIDATPEVALAFQSIIADKYPHFLGAKAKWEVRTLRHRMGTQGEIGFKEALLDDPDFINQDTDSNSLGMVELTYGKEKPFEPVVRDLKNWKQSQNSVFLNDTLNNRISFFRSKNHFTTSRAKAGENPEILSVIRLLVKSFQYELEISPADFKQLKLIVNEFDGRKITNSSALRRIHDTAKKLVMHAVNIEYAINKLDELGLRKKLIMMSNVKEINSYAWWLNREPLRSFTVGGGRGVTAAKLKISIVAHETNNFLAFESITRAHSGEPNVLISRDDVIGESAVSGEGFYTRIGKEGARGTGLTVRFIVNPEAREGTDFIVVGEYIIFKNKKVLTVIQESLNFGLDDLLNLAESNQDLEIDHSDLALLEKLKRKLSSTKINEELTNLLNSKLEADQDRLIQILRAFQDPKKSISKLIDQETLNLVVKNLFSKVSVLANSNSKIELLRYVKIVSSIIQTLADLEILSPDAFFDYLDLLYRKYPDQTFQNKIRVEMFLLVYGFSFHQKDKFMQADDFPLSIIKRTYLRSSVEENQRLFFDIEKWHLSSDFCKRKLAILLYGEMSQAIENDDLDGLKSLIKSGIFNINSKNISDVSILQLAVYYNSSSIMHWVIHNKEFDFNAKNKHGFSEVEQLMLSGRTTTANYIIKYRHEVMAREFEVIKRNPDGTPIINFVRIEPGYFMMGMGEAKELVQISKPFEFMSVHITEKTYQKVIDLLNQIYPKEYKAIDNRRSKILKNPFNFIKILFQERILHEYGSLEEKFVLMNNENVPVVNITYDQVQLWNKGLNNLSQLDNSEVQNILAELFPGHKKGNHYRLPSTAEWEFAARLGGLAEGMYSSGNSVYVLKNYEVNYQNSKGEIQNIGTKLPFFYNGKPIYDLGGHIFVWVEDRDSGITKLSSKNLSQTNLNNINSTKKVRGGNYKSINNWFVIGNAYNRDQGSRYNDVGFRLVRSVEE